MKNKINLFDKIIAPIVTEKSTNLSEFNKICPKSADYCLLLFDSNLE